MEGHHQSSSHRSSPTDADHLQRITALTVNVGKISKSNIGQSNSSANQRSAAQNTMANSASSGGSSDPILAMEKLVKNRIPNSSTSRSWIVSHWLWIIVLVQIQKKSKNGAFDLTMQVSWHVIFSYFSKTLSTQPTFGTTWVEILRHYGAHKGFTIYTGQSKTICSNSYACGLMTLSHFYELMTVWYSMSHTLLGHLQISFLAHTSSKKLHCI